MPVGANDQLAPAERQHVAQASAANQRRWTRELLFPGLGTARPRCFEVSPVSAAELILAMPYVHNIKFLR